MHITPWTDGITEAIEEVERTFFEQIFGPIASGRVERLKLLCRKMCPKDRRKIFTVKMLKRVNRRKKEIDSMLAEQRRPRDLHWITKDMTALHWMLLGMRTTPSLLSL